MAAPLDTCGSSAEPCKFGSAAWALHSSIGAVLARASAADHLIVPFLARTDPEGVEVFMDPGIDALQLHSLTAAAGLRVGNALSDAQRQAGIRAYVNGIPEALCRRTCALGTMWSRTAATLRPL